MSNGQNVQEVESLLLAEKLLPKGLPWSSAKDNVAKVRSALEISGEIIGQLFLEINANTHTKFQSADFILVYKGNPITRMSYYPKHSHTNKPHKQIAEEFRGIFLPPDIHRIYLFEYNKHIGFPPIIKGDQINVAIPVSEELPDFSSAAKYFFKKTNIAGQLEPPPHTPKLEF